MESQSDAAPAVLGDLIAAGLVSHEMIGDPAKLGGETAGLRALCALVSGPVYRIDAYHYAFRAGPGDLDGRLGDLAPGEWTGALETALAASLGEDAVWLNATDLLPEAEAALAQPILLLRAQSAAITEALSGAGPELMAVINARYAAEVARLTAGDVGGGAGAAERLDALGGRLDAIEAGQAALLAGLNGGSLPKLADTLREVVTRLDAQAEILKAHVAREDQIASRLAEIAELGAGAEAFQETIGLALAEFLAELQRRDAGAPAPSLT